MPSVAGRSVRLKNSATATPAAPSGPIEAEESTAAKTSVSRPTITVAPEARIAGAAPRQRHGYRLTRVFDAGQLLAISGHQQQRVVRRGTEDEHAQDPRVLAVDDQSRLPQEGSEPAGCALGQDHREERDEPEDRRAVDRDQQQQHQSARHREQPRVGAREDVLQISREAGRSGDRGLETGWGALQLPAQRLDGLGHDVGVLALQREREQTRVTGIASVSEPTVKRAGDRRLATRSSTSRSAAVSPPSRAITTTAGLTSPESNRRAACSAATDSASPGRNSARSLFWTSSSLPACEDRPPAIRMATKATMNMRGRLKLTPTV